MPKLGVNIDHVATLRQARRGVDPDPIQAAKVSVKAGADSIVCHLREDRRHIQDEDVYAIRKSVDAHLTLEMAIDPSIVELALSIKPDHVMFVPERREELTTEGGLDLKARFDYLQEVIQIMSASHIPCSVFIDPIEAMVDLALKVGAKVVEFHTGPYANALDQTQQDSCRQQIHHVANMAKQNDLIVHAGHGLNYQNVSSIAAIESIDELNIGHAIVSEAVFSGMFKAVKRMKELVSLKA